MNTEKLTADIELINDKVQFSCRSGRKDPVIVDYTPPLGDGDGYTSLELMLISIGTCLATVVKSMVSSRLGKTVLSLTAEMEGVRRERHPTSFSSVTIILKAEAPGLTSDELTGIIRTAEEKICPVIDMIKGNTELITEFELNGEKRHRVS